MKPEILVRSQTLSRLVLFLRLRFRLALGVALGLATRLLAVLCAVAVVVAAVDDVVVKQRRIFYFPFRSLKASKQWNRLKTMEASRVAASARVCCW